MNLLKHNFLDSQLKLLTVQQNLDNFGNNENETKLNEHTIKRLLLEAERVTLQAVIDLRKLQCDSIIDPFSIYASIELDVDLAVRK